VSRFVLVALVLGLVLRRLLFPKAPPPALRAPWVFLLAALAEAAAALLALRGLLPGEKAGPLGQAAAYVLLLLGFALNLRRPGMLLAALGAGANALVVFANGGHMPVFPEALARAGLEGHRALLERAGDATHVLAGEETRLGLLGDWIALPGVVLSPGDLLIAAGVFLLALVPEPPQSEASRA